MHLALHFDENSTWIEHIKNFFPQLAKYGLMLYQIFGFANEHTLKSLYHAFT